MEKCMVGVKKFFVFVLVLCMVLTICPSFTYAKENGWDYVNGDYYYYENSVMCTGWKRVDGYYFYLKEDGKMASGWINVGGNTYYLVTKSYAEENAKIYGAMLTGANYIDGAWHYFEASGEKRVTPGWFQDGDGLHYINAKGYLLVGWHQVDGAWRYFNYASGALIESGTMEAGSILGVDVSAHQGVIDWQAVKDSGVQFAFLRIGHDDHVLDRYFVQNITAANAVGIKVGVYFYSTARTVEEAMSDAQFVIQSLQGYSVSYPVAIDLEDSSQTDLTKQQITDMALAFCSEVRAAGYRPMVYCNENWAKNYIDFSQLFDVEAWIARYNYAYNTTIERDVWQGGSTTYINGIDGFADIDFCYKDYSQVITPRTFMEASYVKGTGYWVKNNVGYWYRYKDGGYPYGGWYKLNGKYYYFDASGYAKTGWLRDGGEWYFLKDDCSMATGFIYTGGSTYYLNSSGAMQTGWQFIDHSWFFFHSSGAMKTGWYKENGNWYYLRETGRMATGFFFYGGNYYYLASSGEMQTGWVKINGKWYYFNRDGQMQTGWVRVNGYWYYLYGDGTMATGWIQTGPYYYYLYSSGEMAQNCWVDGQFYVDGNGVWQEYR